jgi:hypothetical protein
MVRHSVSKLWERMGHGLKLFTASCHTELDVVQCLQGIYET